MSHTFRVWAPNATRTVDVVIGDTTHPMRAAAGGWWTCDVLSAGPGTRHGFSIDSGPVRPDPRSFSQPDGVDGRSEVIDHRFDWTDAGWPGVDFKSAVIYELHVGTFTPAGTFEAAIDKLGHLVELGVDVVELLPVAEFSGDRGWGYDGVDLFAPHHAYGGPVGLKRFVNAAHAAGVGVVLDVVYNHLGPAGNYLAEFGPYFTDRYSTPWGQSVNVDGPHSDEVRRYFIDNALMWLREYHIDGLRLDAVHAIFDISAVHFLEELATEVDDLEAEIGQPKFLVAETDLNNPRLITPRAAGGYGLDAQWNDEFHHCLHVLLTGEQSGYYESFGSMAQLATAYRRGYVFAGEYEAHRGRRHGRPPVGVPPWRFVVFMQNHDQIGNRAQGDRTSHLLDEAQLRLAAAIVLTSPFVPMLFQGEEWASSSPFQYFTAHPDQALGRAVSEGRRSEFAAFGWAPDDVPDPQDSATFERSKLEWDELDAAGHASILEWHRELLRLRRSRPEAFGCADFADVSVTFSEDARWILIDRGAGAVVANFGTTPVRVALPVHLQKLSVIASSPAPPAVSNGEVELVRSGVALLG